MHSKISFRLIFIFTAFIITGSLFTRNLGLNSEVLGEEIIAVPLPTKTNVNFLRQVNQCFLPVAFVYGYTLRVTSEFRSFEEQEKLFLQGREVNGHIVTLAPPGKSMHNFGFAVDVVDRWRGYDINWDKLGKIGRYCGLEQGDQDYDEEAHFQHREGLSTDEFLEGFRPSRLLLPCLLMIERALEEKALTFADLKECGTPSF